MAVFRETPYSAFNYLVELEAGQGQEVVAGFSEVSGLNSEITVAEYRNGNSKTNYVSKIPGMHKSGDITLKRGVIGATNIWEWLDNVRQGKLSDAKRDIVIKMLNEDRSEVVLSWKLRSAMPIKWTGPTLTAKGGSDVAMEELVLSIETIDQE
ncbi:MAG TPA: phage tail protein [Candidatus Tenderia sp.]|nr:phage tail protein [Candidatus Tenderia sp.]